VRERDAGERAGLAGAMRASAARAAVSAPSRSTVMKALSCGFSASIRSRKRVASSTAETSRASSARRSSERGALSMSVVRG